MAIDSLQSTPASLPLRRDRPEGPVVPGAVETVSRGLARERRRGERRCQCLPVACEQRRQGRRRGDPAAPPTPEHVLDLRV